MMLNRNLSDEDDDADKDDNDVGIDDLDPELAALAHAAASGSSAQPEKIVIKIQYTHNYDLSESKMAKMIRFFEKPIKFKVMDVSRVHTHSLIATDCPMTEHPVPCAFDKLLCDQEILEDGGCVSDLQ